MIDAKEILKENCKYKLFLLAMMEHFKEMQSKSSSTDMVRYFRQIIAPCEEILGLKEPTDREELDKIWEKLKNDKK